MLGGRWKVCTMNLEFESERLAFRPICEDDQELIIDLWSDPDVTRFVGGPNSKAELIEEFPLVTRRCGNGCIGIWVLTEKSKGREIGTAILLPMPVEENDTNWDLVVGPDLPDAEIEIGYILRKSAWGKGYATEACARLLEFAFKESPLTEIVATTDPENAASQHVLKKCGLRPEGLVPSYAGVHPGFRITRKQWQQNKPVA